MVIGIAGKTYWLWRAVDQDSYVLGEFVQSRRNTKAAKRLLTRLMKKQGVTPKRIITDKLAAYGAAKRQVLPSVEHRSRKSLNNRAENSHVPLRQREWMMQGFRSVGGLHRFTFVFRLSGTCSFRLAHTTLPLPPTFTGCRPWRDGKPQRVCSLEISKIGPIAVSSG